MDRREFLRQGLRLGGALAGSLLLPAAFAETAEADGLDLTSFDLSKGSRTLKLVRPASREAYSIEYMRNGRWVNNAYSQVCWMLRDVQTNKTVVMDYNLIAIMDWTQWYLRQYGYDVPLHILSGFRSRETNAHTEGAAKSSQHLYGRAIDLRIPGVSTEYLGKLFSWLSKGGVGVYADSEFVHIDTGRVRRWRG